MPLALQTPTQRARLYAVCAYVVASLLSVAWGLSYDVAAAGPMRTRIGLSTTPQGDTILSVRNDSTRDWTRVTVVVDDQFVAELERVVAGGTVDARVGLLANRDRIPRPLGLFYWEQAGATPAPANPPARLRPARVRISCDQGHVEAQVSH